MRSVFRAIAWLGVVIAGVLAFLGIVAWPPEGLMFGLSYFLFLLAGVLGLGSAAILFLTRGPRQTERKS